MTLHEYILDDKNIYLAIYAAKSYVFNPQLLNKKDKELLNLLADPFNEKKINTTILNVRELLIHILEDEDYLFKTQVYYMPKDYNDKDGAIYRPIHTADLTQLIAMVALMHPLIYEIPNEDDHWKLNLSNYSRLIPNNFYGNRVSKRPEELFKKWNEQYKKYTQKANEYLKTFHETKEFQYELKLDLKNFFPSVDPLLIYGILLDNMPVTLCNEEDIPVFKNIIYKLLVCEVTNLNTDMAKNLYYEQSGIDTTYTKGIAQGLPQSYFFGNICMTKISDIFEKEYSGKAVYYVDDSYLYTNKRIENVEDFVSQLEQINAQIGEMASVCIDKVKEDPFFDTKKDFFDFREMLWKGDEDPYKIKVYTDKKSQYTEIQDIQDGEIYLRTLSREASQIGLDITSTYSEEEDKAMLNRAKALLTSIESAISELKGKSLEEQEERSGYLEKLQRFYKFFKYRKIKLQLKTKKELSEDIFGVLIGTVSDNNLSDKYKLLENGISKELFFQNYKHDIWQVAISILIENTVIEHEQIRTYIKNVIKSAYPKELLQSAYIQRMYDDYLKKREVNNTPDYYATLCRQVNRKMVRYANMNINVLKTEFDGIRLMSLSEDLLCSFGICTEKFVETCKIVNLNSDRLKRMFLNAVYSKIFKVHLSEDVVLSSYDKKGITYGVLRLLVFLRNPNCDIQQFFKWKMEVMSSDNLRTVDYTIFEVLGAYKRYVAEPENIDNLIMVHKYTCDVWKNGAKHLYFYTLHNQEHAVDLVKNIIKIVKVFSYLKISNYDYYILFIACYLHDISMVKIASENDFFLDTIDSEKIVTELNLKWGMHNGIESKNLKKTIFEAYKEVDNFFENKIRSKHAKDSAEEIRKRKELDFLEPSVRECVAEIAESHMMDAKDIYFLKGDAKKRLVSYKFDKILLRFADLLDMSENRVSKPILNHNIDNMSSISAFHWVSHLLTEGYNLVSEYSIDEKTGNLLPESIIETVTLSIYVNLSQVSKMESKGCSHGKIKENTISSSGFEIELLGEDTSCFSEKCNFLCRWFNDKNYYLVEEMQALEAYLRRVPPAEKFYDTKIIIKVVVLNPTNIPDEQFEILKKKITG